MSEPEAVAMPDFIRKALVAQGKYDPDTIAASAAKVDLSAPVEHEVLPLFEPPPEIRKWYD